MLLQPWHMICLFQVSDNYLNKNSIFTLFIVYADNPPKSLILKAGYSSMATLIFEYNVVPYIPLLAPLKRFPELEGECPNDSLGTSNIDFVSYRMVAIETES